MLMSWFLLKTKLDNTLFRYVSESLTSLLVSLRSEIFQRCLGYIGAQILLKVHGSSLIALGYFWKSQSRFLLCTCQYSDLRYAGTYYHVPCKKTARLYISRSRYIGPESDLFYISLTLLTLMQLLLIFRPYLNLLEIRPNMLYICVQNELTLG